MKLKTSEKRLLIVLVAVIVAYIYFNYVFFPTLDEFRNNQAQAAAVDASYQELTKSHLTNQQLKTLLNNLSNQYSSLETLLPPQIHQEEAILFLTDLAEKHKMDVNTYSFNFSDAATDAQVNTDGETHIQKVPVDTVLNEFEKLLNGDESADLEQFKDKIYQAPTEKTTLMAQYENDLKYFNVVIALEGDYKQFENYISELETYKSKIIVKQINITKSATSLSGIIGTLTISYPLYFDNEELKPFAWDYARASANTDPFAYEVYRIQSTSNQTGNGIQTDLPGVDVETQNPVEPVSPSETEEAPYASADFYMVLKPANSDANTLTIGKSPFRYTALYADNDGIETSNLVIKKEGNQYLYQYGTSMQTYPGEGEWNEFSPMTKGSLVFEIQSMGRLPENDQAGTLMSIQNDSGLPLTVYLYNEDSTRPRVTINKVSGKITIKKK